MFRPKFFALICVLATLPIMPVGHSVEYPLGVTLTAATAGVALLSVYRVRRDGAAA